MNKIPANQKSAYLANKKCFSSLNFNLISEIIKFLPLKSIYEEMKLVNKNTLKAIDNLQVTKTLKANFRILIEKADFDINNLLEIKKTYFSNSSIDEEADISINLFTNAMSFILNIKFKGNKEEEFYVPKTPGGIDLEILSKFISDNKKFLGINIMDQNIGSNFRDAKLIGLAIKNNFTLQELFLGENLFGENETDMLFLSEGLKANKNLKALWIERNYIGINPKDALYLGEAIKANSSLKEIILFSNYIGNFEDDLKILFEGLMANDYIELIDLSDNCIGKNYETDFALICDFLPKTCLSCLDLGNNDNFIIKDKDRITMLASAINDNNGFLKSLYMNNAFDGEVNRKLIRELVKEKFQIFV